MPLTKDEINELIEIVEWPRVNGKLVWEITTELAEQWVPSLLTDPKKEPAFAKILKQIEETNPAAYRQLIAGLRVKGRTLELTGWENWLRTLGAQTFTREFGAEPRRFLEWNWRALTTLRRGQPLAPKQKTGFIPWSREAGKCLARGTEVLKADGTRVPIEAIVEGDQLISIDCATGHSVSDTVKEVWYTGTKQCLGLRTRTRKYLELTSEHKLWTLDGWKPVSAIKTGDRVAIPRRTRPRPSAARSDEEVRLLAYMIAEGCTTKVTRRYKCVTSHSGFTNADKVIVDDFKACAEAMGFGVSYRGRYGYHMKGCQGWIREMGLGHKYAYEKRIPSWVFQLSERQRWMFLAVMIDTDGWTTKSEGLAICLTSKGLIDDLTYLFLSVGVPSTVRPKKNTSPQNHHQAWTLAADKEYLSRCASCMPLLLKGEKLAAAVSYSRHSLLDIYPESLGRNLPKGANRAIRNAGGPNLSAGHYDLTRPKVRLALSFYAALPQLAWLEQAEIMWDQVVSIEPVGTREVYDLEMASTSHNFIANGIVSHNSSLVEWCAIEEGAILGTGYVIYLAGVQTLAEQHVSSIRDRIEDEHVADYYPHLGKPKVGAHGNRYGWGKDFLLTRGGWAIRPVGLDQAIRGGKTGDMRPTLIIVDDLDELEDSLAVILGKERKLTRSILAMGDTRTRVLVAQNPIHSNSVVNRLLTGVCGALAQRTVFGPVSALNNFSFETRQEDGGPVHVITSGTSNWPGITCEMWQDTLNRVGPEAFLAEYQNDFSAEQDERVLPEYDDRDLRINVIRWSQFIAKYHEGVDNPPKRIPNYWPVYLGGDIGYTPAHLSAFSWITRVPANAPLSGSIFRYRGLTFSGISPDDIAIGVKNAMWPARLPEYEGEFSQVIAQMLSHEKAGERLLFNQKHGFHFQPCEKGKESGVPQWRHFLAADKSQPHPFHPDELIDGKWKLGRPAWFDIVDDDQFHAPRDDRGLKIHRDQAYHWKYKKIKVTEAGQTVEQPMKIADDTNDSTRSLITRLGPPVIPLTHEEKIVKAIPRGYDWVELQKKVAARAILPEQAQMTYESARARAERHIGKTAVAHVDEFGNELVAD